MSAGSGRPVRLCRGCYTDHCLQPAQYSEKVKFGLRCGRLLLKGFGFASMYPSITPNSLHLYPSSERCGSAEYDRKGKAVCSESQPDGFSHHLSFASDSRSELLISQNKARGAWRQSCDAWAAALSRLGSSELLYPASIVFACTRAGRVAMMV